MLFAVERDPKKRRVKPVESAQQSLLDFDLGESSDDSDFRIEDHCEESDDDSVDSNDGKGKLVLLMLRVRSILYTTEWKKGLTTKLYTFIKAVFRNFT